MHLYTSAMVYEVTRGIGMVDPSSRLGITAHVRSMLAVRPWSSSRSRTSVTGAVTSTTSQIGLFLLKGLVRKMRTGSRIFTCSTRCWARWKGSHRNGKRHRYAKSSPEDQA